MSGSVSGWLAAYRQGDRDAAQLLWNRYYARLVRVARSRLRSLQPPLESEEDIALSAFECFCRGIEANRYPQVCDRENFWNLLLFITACKATTANRYESSRKRRRIAESADLDGLVGDEPTPDVACITAESLRGLLCELDDLQLQQTAILFMEGHTVGEIATQLGCSESTIKRKLRRIRETWSHHIGV